MKPKILIITLLLLCFASLSQGSIPPNGLQADLELSHGTPFESAGCGVDDESLGIIANEGVTNAGAGCRSIKVARYFTTQLGRFSQPDPALKGPPGNPQLCNPQFLNPYVYCMNNPLKFNDPSGMVLELAGDIEETRKTLGEMAGKDASALGYNKDGTVTVTATAEQLANNEGLRTIANIAGATEKYQFAVSAEANTERAGAINESVTKRMEFSAKWAKPPAGYAGRTVVASKGSWQALNGSGAIPRMAIAFHELTEVYARSHDNMYYENVVKNKDGSYGPTSPRSGAHPYAIEREKIWQTQGAVGNNFNGAAQYVP